MRMVLTALALIVLPAMAQAQPVPIERGEAVTLTQDDGGVWGIDRAPAPAATAFEVAVAGKFARGDFDAAVGPNSQPMTNEETPVPAPVPGKDKIRLHFVQTPGVDASLLIVENGYGGGMTYRAKMVVKGRSQATDVCLVMPGRVGMEYWPFAIDSLLLSDIKLVMWTNGNPVPCE